MKRYIPVLLLTTILSFSGFSPVAEALLKSTELPMVVHAKVGNISKLGVTKQASVKGPLAKNKQLTIGDKVAVTKLAKLSVMASPSASASVSALGSVPIANALAQNKEQPTAVIATVAKNTPKASEAVIAPVIAPVNNAAKNKTQPTANVKNILLEDFEHGISSKWYREMPNNSYSGLVSTSRSQSGASAYRIELRKTDPNVHGSKRSEIATVDPEKPLEEHTYSFGMLLPKGGEEDYAMDSNGGGEIIAQWHNVPDPGEEWTMPPLALHSYKGRYFLEQNWDDAKLSTDQQIISKGHHLQYDLGSYEGDKGQFVTWTFHVKWGWLKSQKPILEIYKNGVKVLDLNGLPNTMNDQVGVYMKLGIYKWNWAQSSDKSTLAKRVIYYDNVNIK